MMYNLPTNSSGHDVIRVEDSSDGESPLVIKIEDDASWIPTTIQDLAAQPRIKIEDGEQNQPSVATTEPDHKGVPNAVIYQGTESAGPRDGHLIEPAVGRSGLPAPNVAMATKDAMSIVDNESVAGSNSTTSHPGLKRKLVIDNQDKGDHQQEETQHNVGKRSRRETSATTTKDSSTVRVVEESAEWATDHTTTLTHSHNRHKPYLRAHLHPEETCCLQ
jgi:hypothetical protein